MGTVWVTYRRSPCRGGQVLLHDRPWDPPPISNVNPLLLGPAAHHRRGHRCQAGRAYRDRPPPRLRRRWRG